jgi:dihydroorotate dehydrogenase electron transfer subunit
MADEATGEGQSISVLATPLFSAGRAENGFKFAGSIPPAWKPGTRLALRGPLGHGFQLPAEARRVALVAFDHPPARLAALIPEVLAQGAAVTLVCKQPLPELPEEVEIQPLEALGELQRWADFIAAEVRRESMLELRRLLGGGHPVPVQALVRAPMPCGAMAECGVCAVRSGRRWKLICKDGPVFDLRELGER